MDVSMMHLRVLSLAGAFLGLGICANAAPGVPPMPKISAIRLEPAAMTIKDAHDERRVLVLGKTEGEKWLDLTRQAKFQNKSDVIEINAGVVKGKAKGKGDVVVSAAGHEAKLLVTVEDAARPAMRFVRDVEPV